MSGSITGTKVSITATVGTNGGVIKFNGTISNGCSISGSYTDTFFAPGGTFTMNSC